MRSVAAAHYGLSKGIEAGDLLTRERIKQDKQQEIKHTRNADFTDAVASEFLERNYSLSAKDLNYPSLIKPSFY